MPASVLPVPRTIACFVASSRMTASWTFNMVAASHELKHGHEPQYICQSRKMCCLTVVVEASILPCHFEKRMKHEYVEYLLYL